MSKIVNLPKTHIETPEGRYLAKIIPFPGDFHYTIEERLFGDLGVNNDYENSENVLKALQAELRKPLPDLEECTRLKEIYDELHEIENLCREIRAAGNAVLIPGPPSKPKPGRIDLYFV